MTTDDGARKPDNSEGLKNKGILIGIVGVCASGKSTLVKGLEARGYRTRHIAQEHSYVKDMWKRITNPDLLIYLDVSYPTTIQRRNLNWTEADYAEEQRRLVHAREHADLYVNTDPLSIEEVLEQVIRFIVTFHR
jgi:deoxyadenosine/deoxycytidine kinase